MLVLVFSTLQFWGWAPSGCRHERHIWVEFNLSSTVKCRCDCHVSHVLCLLVDLHSWPGRVPGLHQPPFEGEAAETSWAAGPTGRQPQGHRPPPDQLQTKHHSSGQILPGEGPHCDGTAKSVFYFPACFENSLLSRLITFILNDSAVHDLLYIQRKSSVLTQEVVCLSCNETGSKGVAFRVMKGC